MYGRGVALVAMGVEATAIAGSLLMAIVRPQRKGIKTVHVQVKPSNNCSVWFDDYLKLRQRNPCGDIMGCPPGDQMSKSSRRGSSIRERRDKDAANHGGAFNEKVGRKCRNSQDAHRMHRCLAEDDG